MKSISHRLAWQIKRLYKTKAKKGGAEKGIVHQTSVLTELPENTKEKLWKSHTTVKIATT